MGFSIRTFLSGGLIAVAGFIAGFAVGCQEGPLRGLPAPAPGFAAAPSGSGGHAARRTTERKRSYIALAEESRGRGDEVAPAGQVATGSAGAAQTATDRTAETAVGVASSPKAGTAETGAR